MARKNETGKVTTNRKMVQPKKIAVKIKPTTKKPATQNVSAKTTKKASNVAKPKLSSVITSRNTKKPVSVIIKKPPVSKSKAKDKGRLSTVKRPTSKISPQPASAKSSSSPVSLNSFGRQITEDKAPIVRKALDKSQINIRHDVRINGISSLINAANGTTPKVKQLLFDECDIIMECRFCRNLFRSVPNFISHKQNYCKTSFHPAIDSGCSQILKSPSNPATALEYNYFSSKINDSMTLKTPTILENVQDKSTKSALEFYTDIQESQEPDHLPKTEKVNILLEAVENRKDSVVYQRRIESDTSVCDTTDNFHDFREVVDRDTAILGPDGKVICTGTARGIEKIVRHLAAQIELSQRKMVQNSTNQFPEKCDICKTVFTSEKALRQHRRDNPDCLPQSNSRATIESEFANRGGLKRYSPECDNGNMNETPSKRSKNDTSVQLSTEKFIKQLFSSKSPIKKPPYVKLSPYKKTVGKAVKQLQSIWGSGTGEASGCNSSQSIYSDHAFVCIKCSSKFQTTGEMSLHLATMCIEQSMSSPTVNTSFDKRIGIEVRNMYSKEYDDSSVLPNESLLQKYIEDSNISNLQEEPISHEMFTYNEVNHTLAPAKTPMEEVHVVEYSNDAGMELSPYPTMDSLSSVVTDHDYYSPMTGFPRDKQQNSVISQSDYMITENNNNNINNGNTTTSGNTEASSASSVVPTVSENTSLQKLFEENIPTATSESDGEQETVSNVTDSGISSEGNDGQIISDEQPNPSVLNNFNSRPKRNSKMNNRTPKNKTLKPKYDSERRISVRSVRKIVPSTQTTSRKSK